jgi:phage-related protein
MKNVTVQVHQDLRDLSNTSPWLTLVTVVFPDGTTYRLVPNPTSVIFDGVTYASFPFRIGPISTDLKGGLSEVEVQLSNVTREMSALVELYDLRGTTVRIITVNHARIADPTAAVEDITYEVNEYTVTQDLLTARLGHDQLLAQRAPYGRIRRDNCRWTFNFPQGRSLECGATLDHTGWGVIASSGVNVTLSGTIYGWDDLVIPGDTITASGQTRIVGVVTSGSVIQTTVAFSPALSSPVAYTYHKETCSKTLEGPNGCRAHQNQIRIGAFPALPVLGAN